MRLVSDREKLFIYLTLRNENPLLDVLLTHNSLINLHVSLFNAPSLAILLKNMVFICRST